MKLTDEQKDRVRRAPAKPRSRKVAKSDLEKLLDGQTDRLMYLDLIGTAEAALILDVERARIGKWRDKGILLSDGDRIPFPEPIYMVTTEAKLRQCRECGHTWESTKIDACEVCGTKLVMQKVNGKREVAPRAGTAEQIVANHLKLAASPVWWGDDIRGLAKLLQKNKPKD